MTDRLSLIVLLVGIGLLEWGLFQIYRPLVPLTLGASLITLFIGITRTAGEEDDRTDNP